MPDSNCVQLYREFCSGREMYALIEGFSAEVKAAILTAIATLLIAVISALLSLASVWTTIRLNNRTNKIIRILLKQSKSRFVPFYILSHHVGGFEDDELRKLLLAVGAVRVADVNNVEYWVLLSRLTNNEIGNLWRIEIEDANWPPITEIVREAGSS